MTNKHKNVQVYLWNLFLPFRNPHLISFKPLLPLYLILATKGTSISIFLHGPPNFGKVWLMEVEHKFLKSFICFSNCGLWSDNLKLGLMAMKMFLFNKINLYLKKIQLILVHHVVRSLALKNFFEKSDITIGHWLDKNNYKVINNSNVFLICFSKSF